MSNNIAKPLPLKVHYLTVSADYAGQRIDNFLISYLKGVPKSRIYRMLRSGEVRINKKRIKPSYVIHDNDSMRLPPLRLAAVNPQRQVSKNISKMLLQRILYEDDTILVLNKPSGFAVHGGSTVSLGIIEALRTIMPQYQQLELVHRLDTETSGCLIIAKKRSTLRSLHQSLRLGQIVKTYLALTQGSWQHHELRVTAALEKYKFNSGKRLVKVSANGKEALTVFTPISQFSLATLVKAELYTGRTHQIRVHSQHLHHPIAGDDRYGDPEFNRYMRKLGLNRLFLHAHYIEFFVAKSQQLLKITAPLDPLLQNVLQQLQELTPSK
jgi:23S rRNA pseudouridine955/2504/2580 synthase